jgi:hypothetical protein
LLNKLATFAGGPEFDVHPFMNLHAMDNVCGELSCSSSERTLEIVLHYTTTLLTTNVLFSETFMEAKIDAQQDSQSEFVKAVNA